MATILVAEDGSRINWDYVVELKLVEIRKNRQNELGDTISTGNVSEWKVVAMLAASATEYGGRSLERILFRSTDKDKAKSTLRQIGNLIAAGNTLISLVDDE